MNGPINPHDFTTPGGRCRWCETPREAVEDCLAPAECPTPDVAERVLRAAAEQTADRICEYEREATALERQAARLRAEVEMLRRNLSALTANALMASDTTRWAFDTSDNQARHA